MKAIEYIQSATEGELAFIANLDYGADFDKHLLELQRVVQVHDGLFHEGQSWHPYEVVELGAHSLTNGHEREFVLCTLLVIRAVESGFDTWTSLDVKFDSCAATYDMLSVELRELVIDSYLQLTNR